MKIASTQPVKEASFSAVIIRADGTREDLGQIAYYNENILKRILWKLKKLFRK